MLNYAKAIKLLRERKFLTQENLAELLGVKRISVARWETGKFEPEMATKKKICELLKEENIVLEEVDE